MKKLSFALCLAVVSLIFVITGVNAEGTAFVNVKPSQNVGIFESTEDVIFNAEIQNATPQKVRAIVTDIKGEEYSITTLMVQSDMTSLEINLGKFDTGWYRVYFYSQLGNVICNEYVAFTVTEPYETRSVYKDNPFALDTRVGEYSAILYNNDDDCFDCYDRFIEAYKLMGVTSVRERYYYGSNIKTWYADFIDKYAQQGIDALTVWTPTATNWWTENLLNVYTWQKNSASAVAGTGASWEVVNEPDLRSTLPVDAAASYIKAGALAVYDGDADAKKSFGSVCNTSTSIYGDYLMQNELMDYIDSYNVHTHRAGRTSFTYLPLVGGNVRQGRINSTIYGGGSELWVTEAGVQVTYPNNKIPTLDSMKMQAAYLITSYMESVAQSGTDKHFYFLGTHYIESSKEWGIFSENEMPYPAASALSGLTYYLGKGDYLGELRGLKGYVKGYVFDTGSGYAVVLYNAIPENIIAQGGVQKPANVQIDTAEDATIVDMVGGTKTRISHSAHNKINVPVTNSPVIVVLNDDVPIVKYNKKEFQYSTAKKEITNNERLVIQQLWENDEVAKGRHILNSGTSHDITVRLYNFSSTTLNGSVQFKATNQISNISLTSKSYRIPKQSYLDIPVTITVSSDAPPLTDGYFEIYGSKCTPSVAVFRINGGTASDLSRTEENSLTYTKPTIRINMQNKSIWRADKHPDTISADITGSLEDVKVYINYKEHSEFTLDGNHVTIDISDLTDGAYSLIVTGRDEYNHAIYKEVSFYLREPTDWYTSGTFF